MTRFGTISTLEDKKLGFKFDVWQHFESILAIFNAIWQTFIVVNGQYRQGYNLVTLKGRKWRGGGRESFSSTSPNAATYLNRSSEV